MPRALIPRQPTIRNYKIGVDMLEYISILEGAIYCNSFNPNCAVEFVARRRKPKRNAQLERFCDVGILINMSRNKIGKQALQQGFSSRSRRLLHNLGLTSPVIVNSVSFADIGE